MYREVTVKCSGRDCEAKDEGWTAKRSQHPWARSDHFGIYTGIYCNDCVENNYPYKKHDYSAELNHGEYIDEQ